VSKEDDKSLSAQPLTLGFVNAAATEPLKLINLVQTVGVK
jgi:hypothetical protein